MNCPRKHWQESLPERSRPWTEVMTSQGFSSGSQKKLTGKETFQTLFFITFIAQWLFAQDHLGLRCSQTGHLGRVQARHRSDQSARRQDQDHPEQGGHDEPPTVDEGLWSAAVVPVKNPGKSRGRRSWRYRSRYWSAARRSAGSMLEVFGASRFKMLPIGNCLKLNRCSKNFLFSSQLNFPF